MLCYPAPWLRRSTWCHTWREAPGTRHRQNIEIISSLDNFSASAAARMVNVSGSPPLSSSTRRHSLCPFTAANPIALAPLLSTVRVGTLLQQQADNLGASTVAVTLEHAGSCRQITAPSPVSVRCVHIGSALEQETDAIGESEHRASKQRRVQTSMIDVGPSPRASVGSRHGPKRLRRSRPPGRLHLDLAAHGDTRYFPNPRRLSTRRAGRRRGPARR